MNRITESINNVRVDKATHGDYELTFNIVSKTQGLESITVNAVKNGEFVFSVLQNYLPEAQSNVSFYKATFDFQAVQDVFAEIAEIAGEIDAE